MRSWDSWKSVVVASCALLLAGCGAPQPARYYTLLPAFEVTQASSQTSDGQPSAQAIQVLPVSLPTELDTTQLLVRTGPSEVVPLNDERWTGHLSDQIRVALSDRLSSRFGLPSVPADMPSADAPLWRVQVEVQRFESTPQGQAALEAVWRIGHSMAQKSTPLCYSRMKRQSATPDVAGLVLAHQANIDALAAEIVNAAKLGRCMQETR